MPETRIFYPYFPPSVGALFPRMPRIRALLPVGASLRFPGPYPLPAPYGRVSGQRTRTKIGPGVVFPGPLPSRRNEEGCPYSGTPVFFFVGEYTSFRTA
jgi:hypothetical protein